MKVFLTEKNLSGVLSALYYSFTRNSFPDDVKEITLSERNFTDEYIVIEPDNSKSERVKNGVINYGGYRSLNAAKICLLSCEENAIKIAYEFLKLTLERRSCVIEDLSEKAVIDFLYAVNKVLYERHRFTGFIRFKETESGILYAPYSPDNDITALLMPHFIRRFPALPFVIHDLKRNVVGISDGKSFKIVKTERTAEISLSGSEKEWENLFRSYYKTVSIKERKNLKQQDNFLPRRYRKYMPETFE